MFVNTSVLSDRDGLAFTYDLKGRMRDRIQLSTDGHQAYRGSVPYVFDEDEVDWAQIHKEYKSQQVAPGRYSPPACTGTKVKAWLGDPDPARISTSYVEQAQIRVLQRWPQASKTTFGHQQRSLNFQTETPSDNAR